MEEMHWSSKKRHFGLSGGGDGAGWGGRGVECKKADLMVIWAAESQLLLLGRWPAMLQQSALQNTIHIQNKIFNAIWQIKDNLFTRNDSCTIITAITVCFGTYRWGNFSLKLCSSNFIRTASLVRNIKSVGLRKIVQLPVPVRYRSLLIEPTFVKKYIYCFLSRMLWPVPTNSSATSQL